MEMAGYIATTIGSALSVGKAFQAAQEWVHGKPSYQIPTTDTLAPSLPLHNWHFLLGEPSFYRMDPILF